MIKLLINREEVKFTTTIFPDQTSQVWKIESIPHNAYKQLVEIIWNFESEAELIHLYQLVQLVRAEIGDISSITVPYLPYGRQDKQIGNGQSFALETFKRILHSVGITSINTFDAHSQTDGVHSMKPTSFHESLPQHDVICFPDHGASERYKYAFDLDSHSHITFEKVRNQLTGEITGLKLLGDSNLEGRSVLIVDDICDGGMTFIKVAEALQQYKPKQINLAVSHGLFSKGRECLHQAGITEIYTTNSLLRNPEGYKVC